LDLTGLPPTLSEVDAFVADRRSDAYERLVDRLLASPHHGARWARHWMDLVHFAETHGHDQDRIRPNAWPYRDYLIESFNRDTSFDRFIGEQVAADALFPDEPRLTVALGMIAAGPWDESSLRDIREDSIDRQIGRYLDRDDMVTTTMSTFVSSGVSVFTAGSFFAMAASVACNSFRFLATAGSVSNGTSPRPTPANTACNR